MKTAVKTTLIIFGATGDLMARKLTPALFLMMKRGQLPPNFSIYGFGRRDYSDQDFRQHLSQSLAKYVPNAFAPELDAFMKLFHYHKGMFDEVGDFRKLAQVLPQPTNKLFYLAVPPEHYENIFDHLAGSGLIREGRDAWSRILVEKPFGKNLEHAEKLDQMLATLFTEDQVYRIDHYLAKELLQNILMFRFSNNLLEEVWNNQFIESIDIRLLEAIDIEGRGNFYDGTGALLDVGQNHLLQMLALITMERPEGFTAAGIRRNRTEILENIRGLTPQEIKNQTTRGQYAGYTKEKDVSPDSQTETYFRVKTSLNLPRWEGVRVTLEGGKKFPKVQKDIIVTFRHPKKCLCPPGTEHYRNRIHFRIQPNPGISIEFWSKKPGAKFTLEPQTLSFSYGELVSEQRYLEEYSKLLLEAFRSDQTLFVSSKEALASWKFIDPIIREWRRTQHPLQVYEKDEILEQKENSPVPMLFGGPKLGSVGIIGLGRMGGNLARRMASLGWQVFGWNRSAKAAEDLESSGVIACETIADMIKKLPHPRIVWLMVPAGQPVEEMIFGDSGLAELLTPGDILIDGGNSFYKDSQARFEKLAGKGIEFVDIGVSGGPWGALNRPCLMVGGKKQTYEKIRSFLESVAGEGAIQFFEGPGAGHFVKMVHNGIEYGMMQSIAEGFNLLADSGYNIDLVRAADLYNHGSVIESRLVGWLQQAFEKFGPRLEGISGRVSHTGEGEWTVKLAEERKLKAAVLKAAFDFRVRSQANPDFTGKIVSAMRGEFGQHDVREK